VVQRQTFWTKSLRYSKTHQGAAKVTNMRILHIVRVLYSSAVGMRTTGAASNDPVPFFCSILIQSSTGIRIEQHSVERTE